MKEIVFVRGVRVCRRMSVCTNVFMYTDSIYIYIYTHNKYIFPKLAHTHKLKNQIC